MSVLSCVPCPGESRVQAFWGRLEAQPAWLPEPRACAVCVLVLQRVFTEDIRGLFWCTRALISFAFATRSDIPFLFLSSSLAHSFSHSFSCSLSLSVSRSFSLFLSFSLSLSFSLFLSLYPTPSSFSPSSPTSPCFSLPLLSFLCQIISTLWR